MEREREREREEKKKVAESPPPGLSDGLGFCEVIGSGRAEITQQT